MSSDQAKQGFDLNTFSILRVAKGVISSMVQRKQGLIINIGSIAGNM
jgi:short-subunit dehydrogenase